MVSVLGVLPINDRFEIFGRAGYLFSSVKREAEKDDPNNQSDDAERSYHSVVSWQPTFQAGRFDLDRVEFHQFPAFEFGDVVDVAG